MTKLVDGDLSKVDARMVNEAAQLGDKVAINAFRRAGTYLGIGIANLLHLFNPRMVVLGGSVTKAGPLLFDPMHEAIKAHALPFYWEGLAITPAALGDDVGLLGAAALAVTESRSWHRLSPSDSSCRSPSSDCPTAPRPPSSTP